MACTLKNNSFVGDLGIRGGVYLSCDGKCGCGLYPYQHPPPQPEARSESPTQRHTIEPANGLHQVWNCIVAGNIIKEGAENRQWKLGGGACWLDGLSCLYNRVCYDKLIEDMRDKKLVLVKGTPGIGKTTFLERLLVQIVEDSKARGTSIPTIVLAIRERGAVKEYWLNVHGTVEEFDLKIHKRGPEYYLSDSVDSDCVQGFTLHIVVASSKDSNYNHFVKHVCSNNAGLDTNMPLFNFAELLEIRGVMCEAEALFRYTIVGGSARNFQATFPKEVEVLDFVVDVLDWIVRGTNWRIVYKDVFDGYCMFISQRLNKSGVDSFHVLNSLMRHTVRGSSIWASKTMELIGAEIINHREVSVFGELQQLLKAGGTGHFFESLMHRTLTRPGFVCTIKPLHKPHARNVSRAGQIIKLDYPVVLLRNITDLANLPLGRYGLPIPDNFALVDSIVQPDILIQITYSPESHKGAAEALPNIRAHLHEKDFSKHKMVFVVPQKHVATFKFQHDLSDIAQYITADQEVTSVLALYSEHEMRAWKKQRN